MRSALSSDVAAHGFWDGQQWTDQYRLAQQADAAQQAGAGQPPIGAAQPTTVEPRKGGVSKKHLIGYAATALVALLIGVGIGTSGSGVGTTPAAGSTTTKTVASTVTTTATPPAATTVTKVVQVKVTPKPVAAIKEGVWEVGVDIKVGQYKVIEPIQDQCYWEINPTGKDDIVANGTPTGGRPVVNLRKGQTFTNEGCGDWARVK